jgi:hypothetical protein
MWYLSLSLSNYFCKASTQKTLAHGGETSVLELQTCAEGTMNALACTCRKLLLEVGLVAERGPAEQRTDHVYWAEIWKCYFEEKSCPEAVFNGRVGDLLLLFALHPQWGWVAR